MLITAHEQIYEGMSGISLYGKAIQQHTAPVKLPKSLLYLVVSIIVDDELVNESIRSKRVIWPDGIDTPIIKFPIGLLSFNGTKTPYALARPHISQAMLAMHKICTVNGYGKGVAMTIMRAIYETGAILANEWNRKRN